MKQEDWNPAAHPMLVDENIGHTDRWGTNGKGHRYCKGCHAELERIRRGRSA